mmetsp:Transcript_9010/g.17769  ORF Transcript_9010/g.17769 Transcript_9010/m.17769 type:complete len:211 (+) Transcript_9010:1395-2027(+)
MPDMKFCCDWAAAGEAGALAAAGLLGAPKFPNEKDSLEVISRSAGSLTFSSGCTGAWGSTGAVSWAVVCSTAFLPPLALLSPPRRPLDWRAPRLLLLDALLASLACLAGALLSLSSAPASALTSSASTLVSSSASTAAAVFSCSCWEAAAFFSSSSVAISASSSAAVLSDVSAVSSCCASVTAVLSASSAVSPAGCASAAPSCAFPVALA